MAGSRRPTIWSGKRAFTDGVERSDEMHYHSVNSVKIHLTSSQGRSRPARDRHPYQLVGRAWSPILADYIAMGSVCLRGLSRRIE